MSDIICYGYQTAGTEDRYMILRSDGSIEAGTRFPYMEAKIPFGYQSLVDALNRAIDAEAANNGSNAVTDKKITVAAPEVLDFDALMTEFKNILVNIPGYTDAQSGNPTTEEGKTFVSYWTPRIQEITDRYLAGKKVSQCTRAQVEQLNLIVDELNALVSCQ